MDFGFMGCDLDGQEETKRIIDDFLGPDSLSSPVYSDDFQDPFAGEVSGFAQRCLSGRQTQGMSHPDRAIRVTPELQLKLDLRRTLATRKEEVSSLEDRVKVKKSVKLQREMESLLRFYEVMIHGDREHKVVYRMEAYTLAQKAYKLGSGVGAYVLGDYNRLGFQYIPIDLAKASEYYMEATKRGLAIGLLGSTLVFMQHSAVTIGPSQIKVLKFYSGEVEADLFLGILYYEGVPSLEKDYEKAFELLGSLADKGYPLAQLYVGRMYLHGRGVVKSALSAEYYLKMSADKGNKSAQLYVDVHFPCHPEVFDTSAFYS